MPLLPQIGHCAADSAFYNDSFPFANYKKVKEAVAQTTDVFL